MYCTNCGNKIEPGSNFCDNCGHKVEEKPTSQSNESSGQSKSDNKRKNHSVIDHVNEYLGNKNPADMNWKVLFSDVFKKHTTEEGESVFIYGTKATTPEVTNVTKDWPHPWLYSRVFGMFLLAFVLLEICVQGFSNMNAMPGMIVIGAFAVPLATAILFVELNVWRNVSMYIVIKTFLLGGCASLVATLFLFSIYSVDEMDYIGALIVGIIEELGKLIIVFWFLQKLENRTILSGLLIGASVGAGFAAFESAGYALQPLINFMQLSGYAAAYDIALDEQDLIDAINQSIFLRGILAPGGHVTWAAITGAALSIASKGQDSLSIETIFNKKFLRLFIIPVLLHALWDSPLMLNLNEIIPFSGFLLLILAVWIVALILINMGLAEVNEMELKSETE